MALTCPNRPWRLRNWRCRIRSARRGKTLADLSHNIVQGNSLVSDAGVHPRAMDWRATFADVFTRPEAGFDCVIGNPPWERMKLQEREFSLSPHPRSRKQWRSQAAGAYRGTGANQLGTSRPLCRQQGSSRAAP